ncbi:hypothetical protein [Labrys monachus]|uniref:Lipoprotein n=1 Tax=Labrys monachus TaxID=217067 RepID=A0ABU0FHZ8_9HYPH|nr:hypothetical protein [Labrys monachus]MDQ0394225.1 hypothetical protein [Labrys monachus]
MAYRLISLLVVTASVAALASCAPRSVAVGQAAAERPVEAYSLNQKFAEAGDGTVIPNFHPDADAVAFAQRCSGRGQGGGIALGMSECTLVGLKGTPSRFVGGEDQAGHSHDAVWYIERGVRTVYKFDDDRLVKIIE